MIELKRTCTLGEKEFKIVVNRDIAVKSFEEFPDTIIYLKQKAKNNMNEDTFFENALKNKELSKLFETNDSLSDLVKFALPLMLAKANDNSNADEIIAYAEENGVIDDFNAQMFELISSAFTPREQGKPKVKFSMK